MTRWHHRARVVEAAALLSAVGLFVRVLTFKRAMSVAGATLGTGAPESRATNAVALDVGAAVMSAARRLPWKPSCLEQAMAGSMMLRGRGLAGVICFGVADKGARLEAHAWLTVDGGVVCGGRTATRFTPFARQQLGERATAPAKNKP